MESHIWIKGGEISRRGTTSRNASGDSISAINRRSEWPGFDRACGGERPVSWSHRKAADSAAFGDLGGAAPGGENTD